MQQLVERLTTLKQEEDQLSWKLEHIHALEVVIETRIIQGLKPVHDVRIGAVDPATPPQGAEALLLKSKETLNQQLRATMVLIEQVTAQIQEMEAIQEIEAIQDEITQKNICISIMPMIDGIELLDGDELLDGIELCNKISRTDESPPSPGNSRDTLFFPRASDASSYSGQASAASAAP